MHLRLETDTQDMTGTVLCEKTVEVSEEEVEAVIRGFVGELQADSADVLCSESRWQKAL